MWEKWKMTSLLENGRQPRFWKKKWSISSIIKKMEGDQKYLMCGRHHKFFSKGINDE
jgi:hypothetical protein